MVPNLFKTYAHHPPLLRANWSKVKAVMELFTAFNKFLDSLQVEVDF
jgi:hypothetical protein